MNPQQHHNPIRLLAALIGLCILLVAVLDPGMFRVKLPNTGFESTLAHVATDVIGQLTDADGSEFNHSGANNSPNNTGFSAALDSSTIDGVNHRLFVGDGGNNRVMVFALDSSDQLVDRVADFVLGQPDFRSNTAATTQSGFGGGGCSNASLGLAFDSDNNRLFVADAHNSRVLVFDLSGGITNGMNAAFVLGQPDFSTASCADAADAQSVNSPTSIAYDVTGMRLFVSDQGNGRVLVWNLSDGIDPEESAANVLGQANFISLCAVTSQSCLSDPDALTFDDADNRLFVSDVSKNRVLVFDVTVIADGEPAVNVLGQNTFVASSGATSVDGLDFAGNFRQGLAYDSSTSQLFVSDQGNNRVLVFDADAAVLIPDCGLACNGPDAINVLGQNNFTSEIDETDDNSFVSPAGLAFANDQLFVADQYHSRLPIFDVSAITNGQTATDLLGQLDVSGGPVYTTSGADNSPNERGLSVTTDLDVDEVHHRMFVADPFNNRVMVFNLDSSNILTDRIADFVLGQDDFKTNTAGTSAGVLDSPGRVAYDSGGDRLFVCDQDNNRVLVFDVTSIANGQDAVNVLGQLNFTSGGGGLATAGTMLGPLGCAFDLTTNRLFVSDSSLNRVLVFDVATITDGEDAVNVLGQANFTSNGTATTQSGLENPTGLSVADELLYVADQNNNRVMVFDVDPSVLVPSDPGSDGPDAVNVLGQDNFTSGGAQVTPSGMESPRDTFVADTYLFVADTTNNRILLFDIASITDGEDAIDAWGQTDFVSNGSTTTQSSLFTPSGIWYDVPLDTLYIADSDNARVLVFGTEAAPTPTPTPTPPPGGGGDDFTPIRIEINDDDEETDSRNVLVSIFATSTNTFTGTVDVLLSNTPLFSTFVPFRYPLPEIRNGAPTRNIWPKTVAWDLCFGLSDTSTCVLGIKTVYARFYVNIAAPTPALVP